MPGRGNDADEEPRGGGAVARVEKAKGCEQETRSERLLLMTLQSLTWGLGNKDSSPQW